MSERTWPENAWPTSEQFLDWLLTLERDEQLRIAEQTIHDAQAAQKCFLMDHERAVEASQRLGEEYLRGWNDALAELKKRWAEEIREDA